MPKLTIDGKPIEVAAHTTIIKAAEQLGIEIPRYCYHPALPIAGNCRICLVEIEKQPKLQIACYTPVAEGMVVRTDSSKVLQARKMVLEFLLVNHPLDCPVCDQSGECKLQDYYMEHGRYNSRLADGKVKKPKKATSIGPTIMLDQERCILCTRCVRFADTITHTSDFGVFNRGDHSQLDLYPGKELNNNYSGNVADICPVGALTDKDFRFKCRVWYLEKTPSVCPGCSQGCNITIEWDKSRPREVGTVYGAASGAPVSRVMRLKPRYNGAVNDYWMCDEGRYHYHGIDQDRIYHPQFKNDIISWQQAIDKIVNAIKPLERSRHCERIGALASAQLTNEDLFVARKLFKDVLKGGLVDFRVPDPPGASDDFLMKADKNPNTKGARVILGAQTDTETIVQKAIKGELEVLYVFGHDLVKLFGLEAIQQIASHVKLFVFQGGHIKETCHWAHLNIPSSVYAEKDGTFINAHGRVQRIWSAFAPIGEAKADWKIMALLAQELDAPFHFKNAQAVFDEMAIALPEFSGMSYEKLGDQGMMLHG